MAISNSVMNSVLRATVDQEPHFLLLVLKGYDTKGGYVWDGKFCCHGKGVPEGDDGVKFAVAAFRHTANVLERDNG